jgi:hypothetical protein
MKINPVVCTAYSTLSQKWSGFYSRRRSVTNAVSCNVHHIALLLKKLFILFDVVESQLSDLNETDRSDYRKCRMMLT